MIFEIARKELIECRRDGRLLAIATLILLLVLVSLFTGWSTLAEQRRQVQGAQQDDQATFVKQGRKPPHSAAHFGRMAYKPVPPLAVFEPGVAPYLGQVIWLEAHVRNPAMFRPAQDAPELRRLADLSVAGVLTLLLPLLVFVAGYGVFAAERERGTLRQVMSMGTAIDQLFAGKTLVLAGIGIGMCAVAITVATTLALMAPGEVPPADILIRSGLLMLGYAHYSLAWAAVTVFVSARARGAGSALLILLGVWAMSVAVLPRVAASLAEQAHPAPDSRAFWADTADAMRAGRPARDSRQIRLVEREVLGRALGREVEAKEADTMDLNRVALNMEVSEVLGAKTYADAYRRLDATYDKQQQVRRLIATVSPTIALQHLSSALAGTDLATHRDFSVQAERQRGLVIRAMNEDMMLKGAGQGFDYFAQPDLWKRIPAFAYKPPSASFAFKAAWWDLLTLQAWSLLALGLAWRAARRQHYL
ncbi:MAG: ABC transporter permease subunit [Luteimonas sp.]|nr:ABC transporter permease subunit [Luteimonas sp.]